LDFWLVLAVFLPVLGAVASSLYRERREAVAVSAISTGISLLFVLLAGWSGGVLSSGSSSYSELYNWAPLGLAGFRLDGLSLPFALIVGVLSFVITFYSSPYMAHKFREDGAEKWGLYFALYQLYFSGMLGAVLATNLIEFYIFFELMLIPSYFLIAEFGYGEKGKISFMYFIWTHFGALVMLAGLIYMGYSAGSFDLSALSSQARLLPVAAQVFISVALSVGLSVKMAAFGLHVWLPHAHAEAPTPISALLSPAMIGIGGYAFLRFMVTLLPSGYAAVSPYLLFWGFVTILYGGLMALAQDDVKRLLAYSSISQMGYILVGLGSANVLGFGGATLQYVAHGLGKGTLFMMAGVLIMQTGTRSIAKMGGLAKRMPVTATLALIGFLTIMGVPPTAGFISEFFIFQGAFTTATVGGSSIRLAITFLAMLASLLTFGYALWTMKRIFFGKLPEGLSAARDPPLSALAPMFVLCALSIIIGIYPFLLDRAVAFLRIAIGGA
jgi:NADH-quinone oxidoreductase subunit M